MEMPHLQNQLISVLSFHKFYKTKVQNLIKAHFIKELKMVLSETGISTVFFKDKCRQLKRSDSLTHMKDK